ncbi:GRAM domain-containing protein 2A isoform X2 [Ambystoma mexicanum]|uniref:GRAM domain-containing protein 2A isoform X2 n=1 Tax=Ambystoma mexicanum TaxID=8296 RepID=UPI0037E85728
MNGSHASFCKPRLSREKAAAMKSPSARQSQERLEASLEEDSLGDSPRVSFITNESPKDEDREREHFDLTPNKYNTLYHKLFKDLPSEEGLLKAYSCALQREILIQGRLYISQNWLCFYANLFGKDIKVVIPVVSVQLVKKHKTARLLPNGIAITTTASRKYVFVSLLSRDSVYDLLRRVCTHLQASSKKSLSVKEYIEELDTVPLVEITPEVKWRKQMSLLPLPTPCLESQYKCITHRASSTSPKENSFQPLETHSSENPVTTEEEPEQEVEMDCTSKLGPSEYHLLKVFVVLVCILVLSSFYLAFRIFHLEQQLHTLHQGYPIRGHKR